MVGTFPLEMTFPRVPFPSLGNPGAVVVQNQALRFVFGTESQHTKKIRGALS